MARRSRGPNEEEADDELLAEPGPVSVTSAQTRDSFAQGARLLTKAMPAVQVRP